MKVQRLIDADALDITLADAQSTCKKNGGNFRYGVLSNVRANIADAQTVDAIPVEWLVNLKNEYAREGREQAEGDLMNLLLMWQKEQEAKNG